MAKTKFTIISLFPEALEPYLNSSMLYKAQKAGIIEVTYVNLRDFGVGAHKSVDDTPYGGGDGMLLRCEPAFAAIESVKNKDPDAKIILPTPVGQIWNQALARSFAEVSSDNSHDSWNSDFEASADRNQRAQQNDPESVNSNEEKSSSTISTRHYVIFCPHYEGYDERIMSLVDYPVSLGNYVLTGGELPALIIIDSITRLLPGVLGGKTSAEIESFSDGDNLEYPQYTKPAEFRGMKVPEVLLSGHHAKIDQWRREQSLKRRTERGVDDDLGIV